MPITFQIGILSSTTQIILNGGTLLSKPGPAQLQTGLVPQPTAGSYASFICLTSVEKLQLSLFSIYCCQVILNSSWLSWYLVLKIACLHVSFTANENFYKLSKMNYLLVWFSTFQPSEVSENRDPTVKHISTYALISSSISTYVIDLFPVIHFT